MFKVSANFIYIFKIADNINHNLEILDLLYRYFEVSGDREKRLLCKPIIITLVSIIEALLYDFHKRIKYLTIEGVQNLKMEVIAYVQGKHIDKLEKYISSAKKHDFFGPHDNQFYDVLDDLRKLRNRVHIQNEKNHFEPNEYDAFTINWKIIAEVALEKMLKTMNERHPRKIDITIHVSDFTLPWQEHLPWAGSYTLCPFCIYPASGYTPGTSYLCINCGSVV